MKKVILFAAVLFFMAATAHAQISKGSVLLGGNIGFGSSKTEANSREYKQRYLSLSPVVGIAVKPNLVAGVSFTYVHTKYPLDTASRAAYKFDAAGGGFFMRRYFPIARSFYVFGQGSLGYLHSRTEQTSIDNVRVNTSNSIALDVAPGLAYAVSRKFHLELGLNSLLGISYSSDKAETSGIGGTTKAGGHSFNFNTALSPSAPLNLGFRVFLSK